MKMANGAHIGDFLEVFTDKKVNCYDSDIRKLTAAVLHFKQVRVHITELTTRGIWIHKEHMESDY